ncbi:Gds1p NDAI_0E03710 [Naumovozyma dairenensis CBS 421]|uniref:GDS1 winged helix domain-containing protein n=1 Tax=Naumovozyma dairenensis (strain ATCC 10597 / BCRC 20456 / CBS 421 / NBRC 0211 / NRRL Y-12639) TaxID=1071378 RepID=G0WBR8_NAUDC|nr:hypothetical protein NDAI_0E03710 [Naumovozyma dairenensis CBS 421]CCD25188.1 hypothetical protein NDAI_0E03710 [Naumovozyma dairenensis CBS 421]
MTFPGSEIVDMADIVPSLNHSSNGSNEEFSNNANNSGLSLPIPTELSTASLPQDGFTQLNTPLSSSSVSMNSVKSNATPGGTYNNFNNPSNNNTNGNGLKNGKKDIVTPKKENPFLDISKLIPVTGERPKPEEDKTPIDDDVLYAVFVILWEMDPNQQGMTVKQLCDHLLTKHPNMSTLSTKLSNLISAKLNAYVKKIEKGEKTLTYALSREWSSSSPRRMLYIYRGILAPDYKEQAQAVTLQLKQKLAQESSNSFNEDFGSHVTNAKSINNSSKKKSPQTNGNDNNNVTNKNGNNKLAFPVGPSPNGSFNSATKNLVMASPLVNSNTSLHDSTTPLQDPLNGANGLGVSNVAFSVGPEFNIPYSASPVSLNFSPVHQNQVENTITNMPAPSLTTTTMAAQLNNTNNNNASNTLAKKRLLDSNNNNNTKSNKKTKTSKSKQSSASISASPSSSSLSSIASNTPMNTMDNSNNNFYITAVAATPRISKLLRGNTFKSNSATSTKALSAIHDIIFTQMPVEGSTDEQSVLNKNTNVITTTREGAHNIAADGACTPSSSNASSTTSSPQSSWMKIIKDGFLTQDIESPENLTIDDLDNIFD